MIQLNSGWFWSENGRFVPYGANYWPGSCGPQMWQAWPEEEIEKDLDVMADLGMNAIRFFLRWEDFQESPTRFDSRAFGRLEKMLDFCSQRGIKANPSLFVGWMSGRTYYPCWKEGRSMFTDPEVVKACELYCREAAKRLAEREDDLFAVDLGNELGVLTDQDGTLPSETSRWCGQMTSALREEGLKTPILSGCDHTQVFKDGAWRFDNQAGCDLFSIHSYPVPTWLPVKFAGRTDPFAQSLYPFALSVAKSQGPVILQEFGTLSALSEREQREYLESMLPQAWEAGANGFLWWCLRDFDETVYPYTACPFEARLGLVDDSGKARPGLEAFVEFGKGLAERAAPSESSISLYLPQTPYRWEVDHEPGNDTQLLSVRMSHAWHALKTLGHQPGVTVSPELGKPLLLTSMNLGAREARSLLEFVQAGGQVLWHGVRWHSWGPTQAKLLGADLADLRSPSPVKVAWNGEWTFCAFPEEAVVQPIPRGAEVLASDSEGRPFLFRNRIGKGVVVWTTGSPEDQMHSASPDMALRDSWVDWFRSGLAALSAMA